MVEGVTAWDISDFRATFASSHGIMVELLRMLFNFWATLFMAYKDS